MPRSGWPPRWPARPRSSAVRRRAGSTSWPRPPASLNVRIADLERLNRIDPLEVFTVFDGQVVGARRPRRERQGRAARRRRRHGSTRARGWPGFGSHPLVWVAPFIPSPGRGHRQGVGPRDRTRAVRGQRPRQGRGPRLDDRVDRLRRRRPGGGRGGDGRLRPPARPARAHPDRRRGQHRPARCRASWPSPRSAGGSSGAASRPTRARCCGWRASAGRRSSACRPAAPTPRRRPRTCCCPGCCPASDRRETDRRQARPRRDPHPQPALPLPGLRPRARRARRLAGERRASPRVVARPVRATAV